jgi:hypothetical protein
MVNERSFSELNVWQKIFAEHWDAFTDYYIDKRGHHPPAHWYENVERMLSCGDIREGYYEYQCFSCGATRKVGFTCKSRLCLRCVKSAVDDWLEQVRSVLFEGVIHRQVVLTIPQVLRPLVVSDAKFMKAFVDAGAAAIKSLIEGWRPKLKIRVGLVAVMQLHGRSGNQNPHLHFVVSEGGVDKDEKWRNANYFDTRKLRKMWQYHVIMGLKKAVRGSKNQKYWNTTLGSMFKKYPSGFDCNCMPEKGAVERLIVYLCKYVSSPPISLRRIVKYDGQHVSYRYEDHRRGQVCEKVSAVQFIERMIQNLPPKGFRMVRYYGIYARPVRQKIYNRLRNVLAKLVRKAENTAKYFSKRYGTSSQQVRDNMIGKSPLRCKCCGSTDLELICIWDKNKGFIYQSPRAGPSLPPRSPPAKTNSEPRFVQMLLPI